jgi:hypothetical protein
MVYVVISRRLSGIRHNYVEIRMSLLVISSYLLGNSDFFYCSLEGDSYYCAENHRSSR